MKRIRCAIYTRKSSDEGLEQDFNSLDAQREACEAFVKSQAELGWRVLPELYDDGGFSGGTLERPALARLLDALEKRLVDVIVIYKIDRLTRSLADFARLAERFEALGVSFVSVTQQFNTATSMGRLMLNVLLSFAQFEREITGERIRDKFAASRKKGMWMGGNVPLGYDLEDRALHVNHDEAKTVRKLYALYLEHGSVTAVQLAAKERGLRTKRRVQRDGREGGHSLFSRGHLHRVLSNPLYCGEVSHKGKRYPGQHEAIIDVAAWERVQAMLESNRQGHQRRKTAKHTSPLTGLLYKSTGERYVPSHTSRSGKRYRYYELRRPADPENRHRSERLPAGQIEGAVRYGINELLVSPARLKAALGIELSAERLKHAIERAKLLGADLAKSNDRDWRDATARFLQKIVIDTNRFSLHISPAALMRWLSDDEPDAAEPPFPETWTLEVPCRLARRGEQLRIIIESSESTSKPDAALIKLLQRANRWRLSAETEEGASMEILAKEQGVTPSYFARIVRLAYLAPDIVEAIVDGKQPATLTATKLARVYDLPIEWPAQRHRLGFPPV